MTIQSTRVHRWFCSLRLFLACQFLSGGAWEFAPSARGENGDTVAVVYNSRLPESKKLAEYYRERRQVPASQVFGLDLPVSDTIPRAEFREQLQNRLLKILEEQKLWVFKTELKPATAKEPGEVLRIVSEARIRYLVLCHGVPVRILSDPNLVEEGAAKTRAELRRNEASVDSELALLPASGRFHLFGLIRNPLYNAPSGEMLDPTQGVLMVARLDGPTVEIARGLVDKALQAEADGLWGRAYFDVRGVTDRNLKLGDEWIRGAAQVARRLGFETIVDEKPETFPASFPMSQIAFYAGWYDAHVSGPFTRPQVEFMPGAVAYHLHSYSGHAIRSTNGYWVGPLLAKGVTATMGCVDEPYLEGTPDVAAFFQRLLKGFSFGEAAYAAQNSLSWQTTVIGDPLYRPFAKPPPQQHKELSQRQSKLLEWSHLRIVNLNLETGLSIDEGIGYLEQEKLTRQSAVLEEKLGDLWQAKGQATNPVGPYLRALKLDPTTQQRIRLMLSAASKLSSLGREAEACELYRQFVQEQPDYPDLLAVYPKLLSLAQNLGMDEIAERCKREINRLSLPNPKP